MKKEMPLDLNPSFINKLSKAETFKSLAVVPRGHQSSPLKSRVAENVKLYHTS